MALVPFIGVNGKLEELLDQLNNSDKMITNAIFAASTRESSQFWHVNFTCNWVRGTILDENTLAP